MAAPRVFNIGISMAGAVSGGAYSAGVFDFLMEALGEWQKAKARGDFVPQHEVYISALSGTSAGGITAALGLASLAGGLRSVEAASVNPANPGRVKRTLPELYDIWVKKVRLFREALGAGQDGQGEAEALLDTGDAKPGSPPPSLLNSDVLTAIARKALLAIRPAGQTYPFFTDPTHLFLTHTNLDGVPYPVEFTRDGYSMMLHEGRTHFAVRGLGQPPFPRECKWLERWGDTGIAIDLSKLGAIAPATPGGELKEPFETLAQAALTTSAFPFGFSARRIAIDRSQMRQTAMPFDPGRFPDELKERDVASRPFYRADTHAHFVCVDGGAMNNEPFEIVRWTIKSEDETRNVRDSRRADRAVILIAPFPPQAADDAGEISKKDRHVGLDFIGKALVPALINQARFKASDLIAASDPNVYSRFLISPSRDKQHPALASSALEAFGGFLDEQYREHDFQLGRRNCQWFLRRHFTLHRENPLFAAPDAGSRFAAVEDRQIPYEDEEWPIIPLVGSAAAPIPLLGWPVMPRRNLKSLKRALLARLDVLTVSFADQVLKTYPSLRTAARLSWWRHRGDIVQSLVQSIDDALAVAGQIEEKPAPGAWDRFIEMARRVPPVVLGVTALVFAFALYDLIFNWGWPFR